MLDDKEIPGAISSAVSTIENDRPRLNTIQDYYRGRQMKPRIPATADRNLVELTDRSIINLMRLAVSVPAQQSFIDGFSSVGDSTVDNDPPEWGIWEKSGFKSQQTNLFRASLKYGQAFAMVDPVTGLIKLLPTRDTTAFFEDPVNDRVPVFAVTKRAIAPGKHELVYIDSKRMVNIPYENGLLPSGKKMLTAPGVEIFSHELGQCPVVRFTCELDDEGNATGVIEPLIQAQNRVNQSSFDLLVTQTFGSFKVRWAAGLTGEPILDKDGQPIKDHNNLTIYRPLDVKQDRFLMTDNPEARFGTLDSTPLDGFISALDNAIRSFAVMANIPPHSLLGAMSNLSAETIAAAMGQTNRFTHMLKTSWGESTIKLMELVRVAWGIQEEPGVRYEVRWRDTSDVSLAQVADALGKAATQLGVPGEGLWSRIPGVTDSDLKRWRNLRAAEQDAAMFDASGPAEAAARESRSLGIFGGVNASSNPSAGT